MVHFRAQAISLDVNAQVKYLLVLLLQHRCSARLKNRKGAQSSQLWQDESKLLPKKIAEK